MRIAFFNTRRYDRQFFDAANLKYDHEIVYFEPRLDHTTAPIAAGFPAVCLFVNDCVGAKTLEVLAAHGTQYLLCAVRVSIKLISSERRN